jgi:hypothetical protein
MLTMRGCLLLLAVRFLINSPHLIIYKDLSHSPATARSKIGSIIRRSAINMYNKQARVQLIEFH